MERINRIIKHKLYLEYVEKIKTHEKNRIFCKHDTGHFLDVCRLAEIDLLEHRISEMEKCSQDLKQVVYAQSESRLIDRELIYAAGLLHDIGRWQEYENGTRHEIASSMLAPEILKECNFSEEEIKEIVIAISNHRNSRIKEEISLSGFLYRADKKSRSCFLCEAEPECDWPSDKKNLWMK